MLGRLRRALDARQRATSPRILLSGSSAARDCAAARARSPSGIAGLVLAGYRPDNVKNTVVWQNTVGVGGRTSDPRAADDAITRRKHEAVKRMRDCAAPAVRTGRRRRNGIVTSARLTLGRLDFDPEGGRRSQRRVPVGRRCRPPTPTAGAEPTQAFLLKLDIPIGIFTASWTHHASGVRETVRRCRAFELTVRRIPASTTIWMTPLT